MGMTYRGRTGKKYVAELGKGGWRKKGNYTVVGDDGRRGR